VKVEVYHDDLDEEMLRSIITGGAESLSWDSELHIISIEENDSKDASDDVTEVKTRMLTENKKRGYCERKSMGKI
jgi:hypothetical protein